MKMQGIDKKLANRLTKTKRNGSDFLFEKLQLFLELWYNECTRKWSKRWKDDVYEIYH